MRINIRKAGPLIATGLACAGVIATALLAAKKAPEVREAVEEAHLERGEDLKPIEVVKAAAPLAWPVCAAAAGTIACIVGIQAMNQKQQASLVAMYGVAAKSLKKYDSKIKELFGEDAPTKVKTAIAQDTANEAYVPNPIGDACMFYDMISGRYFTSTMLEVRNAEYHFNRNFVLRGGQAVLNELYDFLGLDHIEGGDIQNHFDELLAKAKLAEADFCTPQEKRKWAYENELSIIYRGEAITVDAANKQFMEYTAEGAVEKCQELQQLIAAAKDTIRNTYPDEMEV